MGAQFEDSLSKIPHFECVMNSWAVGVLSDKFGAKAVEARSEVHKGEEIGVLFVGHMSLLSEDQQGYPCISS
jgi:hypothetical protein